MLCVSEFLDSWGWADCLRSPLISDGAAHTQAGPHSALWDLQHKGGC